MKHSQAVVKAPGLSAGLSLDLINTEEYNQLLYEFWRVAVHLF